VPGFKGLIASTLLSRTSDQMWTVGVVLFVLQRYHSASLAGLSVFLLIAPGLVASPITGALLDRYRRKPLMLADFAVAYVSLALIVVLAVVNQLPPLVLLAILTVGSFTSAISVTGARSLFPLTVPSHLWDRANALDSVSYAPAFVAGPALAGAITAWFGGEVTLGVVAVGYVLASVAFLGIREPPPRPYTGSILRSAWQGVVYVLKSNPTLRWLALAINGGNLGGGIILVALPLIVFRNLHGDAALVGELFALQGVAGLPSSLLAGRLRTQGRERRIMCVSMLIWGLSGLLLLPANLLVVAIGMLVAGVAQGPFDVALFSLRQRRTHPSWFGRAFAISMSLNFIGMPIGSAISGPFINRSITLAILVATVLTLFSALLMVTLIPAQQDVPEA
jgi:MFS family permease